MSRVAIVGVGLIGGSMGLAWRRAGAFAEVVGADADPAALDRALASGAIDRAAPDLESAVDAADLVVLAAPVEVTIALAPRVAAVVRPGTTVTDTGSTKRRVVAAYGAALAGRAGFVGGHPMAGSDRSGVGAADPFLFQNAVYLLTPTEHTPAPAVQQVEAAVRALGAWPYRMAPEEHDAVAALVSHLPQVVAMALVLTLARCEDRHPDAFRLAAGGFRDTTRVASSPPDLWRDIFATNADRLAAALDGFGVTLDELAGLVRAGDAPALAAALERARVARDRLPAVQKGLLPGAYDLVAVLEDRPGALGRLCTVLGDAGLNIRDLEILRIREGEGGTVRLSFGSEADRGAALDALGRAGYAARARE